MTNSVSGQTTASRLLRAVLAKTFIEILLLCVIATVAAFSNFNPLLRGAIDIADRTRVAGWAHDPMNPDERVEVQLFINGRFAANMRADIKREDLVSAGVSKSPNHGFNFNIESIDLPPGGHEVQVYAVRGRSGASKHLSPLSQSSLTFTVIR